MAQGSFVAEVDVNRSADGVLFLFHDDRLDRMTRNSGPAAARPWAELDTMRLVLSDGRVSEYTIPSLDEVLGFARGKCLVSLDRKQGVRLVELTEAAVARDMLNQVSLILYDQEDYREWAELSVLGPMSHEAVDAYDMELLNQRNRELYARFGVSPFRENGSRPTSGFLGVGQPQLDLLKTAKSLRIRATVGTFGELDARAAADGGQTYRDLIAAGVSVIATNRPLAASAAIYRRSARP